MPLIPEAKWAFRSVTVLYDVKYGTFTSLGKEAAFSVLLTKRQEEQLTNKQPHAAANIFGHPTGVRKIALKTHRDLAHQQSVTRLPLPGTAVPAAEAAYPFQDPAVRNCKLTQTAADFFSLLADFEQQTAVVVGDIEIFTSTQVSFLLQRQMTEDTVLARVPHGWRHNPKAAPVKDQGPRGSVALCFAMKVTSVLQHKAPEPTTLTAHILGTKNRLGVKEEHPGGIKNARGLHFTAQGGVQGVKKDKGIWEQREKLLSNVGTQGLFLRDIESSGTQLSYHDLLSKDGNVKTVTAGTLPAVELPSLLPSFPGRGHQEYLEEAEEGEADEETRLQ
ncbi:hypothetical protein Anapl_09634 [Anas platyrhynchos]|uniref:Uncharacterized protein n=1 Tax=Anas platyrhynchos TaxID=8839 RepID=R0JJP1_ANAPL|nr:hypothetical protein Anapl_09634 [Anas platyrhynchos]